MGIRAQVAGLRVESLRDGELGIGVWGLRFGVKGLGIGTRDWGLGIRVEG